MLSLFLSLCNPMFFAAIPPSCGFHWLLLFEERERESQIVQVFAPISLGIFVVLTGFCLMRESHNFLSTLSFLLVLLILPTIFNFIFWVLWMFCEFMFPSIIKAFFLFFPLQLSIYLPIFLHTYPTHLPTYLPTYLPYLLPILI